MCGSAGVERRGAPLRSHSVFCPTLAPDGLLFAVGALVPGALVPHHGRFNGEIVAFDAATLAVRRRFGRGYFLWGDGGRLLAMVGDELYACNSAYSEEYSAAGCIRVFSMSGEHLRVIEGDWHRPQGLLYVRDRLYLYEAAWEQHEDVPENETAEEETERLEARKRIFVLTPQGETIQKYRFDCWVDSMAVIGDKLVVRTWYTQPADDKFIALKGV